MLTSKTSQLLLTQRLRLSIFTPWLQHYLLLRNPSRLESLLARFLEIVQTAPPLTHSIVEAPVPSSGFNFLQATPIHKWQARLLRAMS